MSALSSFDFGPHRVRVFFLNEEPWFIAKDVADALRLSNSRSMTAYLDDEDKGVQSLDTLAGRQDMTIISESGLYTIALRSRQALTPGTIPYRFRKWVTGTVLPALRRTGAYQVPRQDHPALTRYDRRQANISAFSAMQSTWPLWQAAAQRGSLDETARRAAYDALATALNLKN